MDISDQIRMAYAMKSDQRSLGADALEASARERAARRDAQQRAMLRAHDWPGGKDVAMHVEPLGLGVASVHPVEEVIESVPARRPKPRPKAAWHGRVVRWKHVGAITFVAVGRLRVSFCFAARRRK